MSGDPKSPLTREHVVWAYRLLLDRDPENEDVIGPKLAGSRDTADLRRHLMTSAEFQEKNRDYAHTNDRTLVITEIEHGVRLFVDLSDHVIGLNIVRGHYEQDEARFARSVLKPGDIAIDAGAHIGFFTMQMAAAVGASSGTATLTFPLETLNTGGAYLLREATSPVGGNRTRDVPVLALDDLPLRRPVRFIKMDVEGAEPLVMQGAARLLRDDRPVVLSELHPTQLDRASGTTGDSFLSAMRAAGYRAHLVEHGQVGAP